MSTKKPMTASEMGRKGGKRSLETMSKKARSERALKAVQARWAKDRRREANER